MCVVCLCTYQKVEGKRGVLKVHQEGEEEKRKIQQHKKNFPPLHFVVCCVVFTSGGKKLKKDVS